MAGKEREFYESDLIFRVLVKVGKTEKIETLTLGPRAARSMHSDWQPPASQVPDGIFERDNHAGADETVPASRRC
jgi:hypothetical protein